MEQFSREAIGLINLITPIVVSLAVALLVAISGCFLESPKNTTKLAYAINILYLYTCYCIPVSLIGYTLGYLSGLSRTSILGNVLPAVLALIGGVTIYVYGAESRYKVVVGASVCALVISLLVGAQTGAEQRDRGHLARLIRLSEEELQVENYRKHRGLSADFPSWIVPQDAKSTGD
jgi:hypothetical protein